MKKIIKSRGGKRAGSGRKKLAPTKTVSFRVKEEDVEGVKNAVSEGAAVASSAVGSQTSARTCATGCDWPNCTLEGCVDPKCDC